jgi:hypothetical protein
VYVFQSGTDTAFSPEGNEVTADRRRHECSIPLQQAFAPWFATGPTMRDMSRVHRNSGYSIHRCI